MTASTSGLVPAPRQALKQLRPVPFRLPWERTRIASRAVIGDALLLQYALQKRSIRCMPELTVRQAREMLAAWVSERQSVMERRDDVVRIAFQAGLSKAEVHRLTGIARTTIDRILVQAPEVGKGDAE